MNCDVFNVLVFGRSTLDVERLIEAANASAGQRSPYLTDVVKDLPWQKQTQEDSSGVWYIAKARLFDRGNVTEVLNEAFNHATKMFYGKESFALCELTEASHQ